jgi:hypothetical protein
MNRDIYQKIASLSDDKTALAILATNKEMNKDIYYLVIFGNRYPDLIKYRKDNESIKNLYLRSLQSIGKLKEEYGYTYVGGNPELQLNIFKYGHGNRWNFNQLLFNASKDGSLELVKYALEEEADIDFKYNDENPLIYASLNGHLEVVKYLVEKGANIHGDHYLALKWASEQGHLEVVKYLAEHGADIHDDGEDALRRAIVNGHLEVVKYLIEQGDNIYSFIHELRQASEKGHLEVVKYLKNKIFY